MTLFYLGGECCIEILEHPDWPRLVSDCRDPAEYDEWCVKSHGSVGGATCPDGDCLQSPVASESWGAIKCLYR
jgi:hypothetical protein